jgi:hypothetical protein
VAELFHAGYVAERLGGKGQPQAADHLPGSGCYVGRNIFTVDQVEPGTVLINKWCGKMGVHLAAGAEGLPFRIRVGVQLGKELLNRGEAGGEHKGLVAVISRPEISGLEELGHGHLGHFLAIAENAEFGLACQDLFPAQEAGFPADAYVVIIKEHLIPEAVKREFLQGGLTRLERIFHATKIGFRGSPLKKHKMSFWLEFPEVLTYFWCKGTLMRKIMLLVITVLSLSCLRAQDAVKTASTVPEVLVIRQMEHDFGKIPQGKPVFYYFEVHNGGIVPLKLDNVQASCGCTTPEWSKDAIPAGGNDRIKVGYNAAAEGYFEKYITVTYNGNETKQIKIKGTVWKAPAGSAPANPSVQFLKQQIQ